MDFRDVVTELANIKRAHKVGDSFKLQGVTVTLACDKPAGGAPWAIQIGDNQQNGEIHNYAHWATGNLSSGTDCKALAKDLKGQIIDLHTAAEQFEPRSNRHG